MKNDCKSDIIDKILATKNYYDIFALQSDCSMEDVKMSYRKIALNIHPDRCKNPRATEAFQKVSHAYQILTDERKRSMYDKNINDENFEDIFDGNEPTPDEIFAMFFKCERSNAHSHYKYDENDLIYQSISIVLLLIITIIGGYFYKKSNKLDLQDEITFDDLNNDEYSLFESTKYHIKFGLPKSWLSKWNDHNDLDEEFYKRAQTIADAMYVKKLQKQCQLEKTYKLDVKPKCEELQSIEKI